MAGQETQRHAQVLSPDAKTLARAAGILAAGGLVAVPTETVYGLAALATSDAAVARVFAAKGRPQFNPLISHVDSPAMAEQIARFTPLARRLAAAFWPGPLTLVLPRSADCPVSPLACAGLETIAVRMPDHAVTLELISRLGAPIAAPSANPSGRISPTCADHVAAGLGSAVDLILDAGPTRAGLESTVIAVEGDRATLLRPGPITADMLMQAVPGLQLRQPGAGAPLQAPGALAAHYAPSKPLRLDASNFAGDEYGIGFGRVAGTETLSASGDVVEAAANLFAALHRADAAAQPRIAIAPVPQAGLGLAINDRLRRAAAGSGSPMD